MKKLSLLFFVAVVSMGFVACGNSKDSDESQTINFNNSQVESNESSADSNSSANPQDSNAQSSQSLVWELVDCDFLIKLWGITEKDCGVMDIPPEFVTIEAKNIEQAYKQLLFG